MIEFVSGDLFAEEARLTVIGHGVNLRGAFGAGIAGTIAEKYPWAKDEYLSWLETDPRLGDVYLCGEPPLRIAHMATQVVPGPYARVDAISEACRQLVSLTDTSDVIGLPKIGCGIGGLSWRVIRPILRNILGSRDVFVFETYVPQKGT